MQGGQRTAGRRVLHRDRIGLLQLEIDEIGRVIDHEGEGLFRRDRLLQRQREAERDELLVVGDQLVILRLAEFVHFGAGLGDGEILEFGQRFDIGLGERRQFLPGRRLAVLAQPLRGEGGIHFVEGPDVAEAGDLAVRPEQNLRPGGDPDMGMGESRRGEAQQPIAAPARRFRITANESLRPFPNRLLHQARKSGEKVAELGGARSACFRK